MATTALFHISLFTGIPDSGLIKKINWTINIFH